MVDVLMVMPATASIPDAQGILEPSTMASRADHAAWRTLFTTILTPGLITVAILPVFTTLVKGVLQRASLPRPKPKEKCSSTVNEAPRV